MGKELDRMNRIDEMDFRGAFAWIPVDPVNPVKRKRSVGSLEIG